MSDEAKPAEDVAEISVAIELGSDEVLFYFPRPVTNFAMTHGSIEHLLEEVRARPKPPKTTEADANASAAHIAASLLVAGGSPPAGGLPSSGMTVLEGPAAAAMLENSLNFGREVIELAQSRGLKPYQVGLACTTILESFAASYGWSLELLRKTVRSSVAITETPVVHALAHGEALCGIPGMPSEWPANHSWVSAFVAEDRPKVTCLKCARKAALMQPGGSS